MPKVVGVRLRYSKTLWFDPGELEPKNGDLVLVSTERGTELGMVYHPTHEVDAAKLPAELKPVIRITNDEDIQKAVEFSEQEKDAFPHFVELIKSNNLDMNPIDVEYVFSGETIVFYFSADERIDFRGLVKDLAAHFKQRIDMRQIGVRDEARRVGGIGHCGQELCCSRLGGEFAPVGVKMAKDQGLPLNPAKISGLCGRLMCCLRYEVEVYKNFNARAPKHSALISTPRGDGKVINRDALRELITLQFQKEEGGWENMPVPLGSISCCKTRDKGQPCPCHISEDDFAELNPSDDADLDMMPPEPKFKSDSAAENDKAAPANEKLKNNGRKTRSRNKGKSQGKKPQQQGENQGNGQDSNRSGNQNNKQRATNQNNQNPQQRKPRPRQEASNNSASTPTAGLGERIPRRRRRED